METVRTPWEQDGQQRESVVTCSPTAAEDYVQHIRDTEGATNVRIVPTKP